MSNNRVPGKCAAEKTPSLSSRLALKLKSLFKLLHKNILKSLKYVTVKLNVKNIVALNAFHIFSSANGCYCVYFFI